MAKGRNKIFEISLLALCVVLASCSRDDNENDAANSGGNGKVFGENTISVNGGASASADAGNGGNITVNNLGVAAIKVSLQVQNLADTITKPEYSAKLGAEPATISADTTLEVSTILEPPAGQLYAYDDGSVFKLYVSDGNSALGNETPVTGLRISSGKKLLLQADTAFTLANDLHNEGVIVTEGAALTINADNYVGSNTSKIDLSGVASGAAAGDLILNLSDSFYNEGSIVANGQSDSTAVGGDAGSVAITAQKSLYNSGAINVLAGNSSAANVGGKSASVNLQATEDLINTGNITVKPGTGDSSSRGAATDITLQAKQVFNSGDLFAVGVSTAVAGDALDGGNIVLKTLKNTLVSTGNITVNGAVPTVAANGGKGGTINFNAATLDPEGSGVFISGKLEANGAKAGDSYQGGAGGVIALNGTADVGDWVLSGYEMLQANGAASGQAQGGEGGSISFTGKNIDIASTSLHAQAAAGVDGVYSQGGAITFNYAGAVDSPNDNSMNIVADINVVGDQGALDINHSNGNVKYAGTIAADAKADTGIDFGKSGGSLLFKANSVDVKGRISANGTNGLTEGGNGGNITVEFIEEVALNMFVRLNGGDADESQAASIGGKGGDIYLRDVKQEDFSNNSINYNAFGGKGDEAGKLGCIYLSDKKLPSDDDCPL